MAEKLIGLKKKGGGKLKETILWTNPNPNSNFSGTAITLLDSIANYTFIVFEYKASTTTSTIFKAYVTPDDLRKSYYYNSTDATKRPLIGLGAISYYVAQGRMVTYQSDTNITIQGAYRFDSSAAGNDNSMAIPLYIKGLR